MSDAAVLSKSQFAKMVSRDASQVTRWLESGKLHGDALIGEGRNARINVPVALRQLNISLDLGQQLAQAKPILPGQAGGEAPADGPQRSFALPVEDSIEADRREQIKLNNEKLRQQLERGAREDAVASGQLVDVGAVKRAMHRQLQPLATIFEQLPAAIAKPISEQFGIPYNDALIAIRNACRRQRHQMSETLESLERSTV
jgi:hypothetical protein